MQYISTRGGMTPSSYSEVLLEGLATDGGLSVPESYPQITAGQLEDWRDLSYPALATEILSLFATDIPRDELPSGRVAFRFASIPSGACPNERGTRAILLRVPRVLRCVASEECYGFAVTIIRTRCNRTRGISGSPRPSRAGSGSPGRYR